MSYRKNAIFMLMCELLYACLFMFLHFIGTKKTPFIYHSIFLEGSRQFFFSLGNAKVNHKSIIYFASILSSSAFFSEFYAVAENISCHVRQNNF